MTSLEAVAIGVCLLGIAAGMILTAFYLLKRSQKQPHSRQDAAAAEIIRNSRDAILTVSQDGTVESFYPSASRLFGYAAEEAIGKSITELVPPPGRRSSGVGADYIQAAPNGRQLLGRRKDGSTFPVEVTLAEIAPEGRRMTSVVIRDISERARQEIEKTAERDFISSVLDIAGALIVVLDHEGRIVRFNRACEETTDYSYGEVKGKHFWDVLATPEESESVKGAYDRLLAGEFPARTENSWVTRDGARREISWAHTALMDRLGRVEHVVSIGMDVTEQRMAEQQLLQTRKMEAVGRLAGGVAHDFNNLLTAITGYSDLILHSIDERDPIRKDVEEIKKAGDRAASLTRQLLALSRRQAVQPAIISLNAMVSEMEEMLRRLIGEDIDLRVRLDNELSAVKADTTQMEQVLLNLAVNARDAMERGGELSIETSNVTIRQAEEGLTPGHYVCLMVRDSGAGMDEHTKSHLFEPFFTTKEMGKGTGLGLSMVYNIVRQSAGAITVESEVGKGSTFRVYLPQVAGVIGAEASRPRTDPPPGTETVLLVEDEEEVLVLVRRMLLSTGYQVMEARSAADAIELAQSHSSRPIHLLITDVVLPKLGGPELARRLSEARPEMKVIYISGYDTANQQETLAPGAAFLQKPFTPEDLARKVREVLDAAPASM